MQNKFFIKLKQKISWLLLITFCLITNTGCLKQMNNNFTLMEAKKSYHEGDTSRAFHLAELLAMQNNPEAMYAVGYMHYYGIGAPFNQKLAIAWFKQSEERGNEAAKIALNRLALADPNMVLNQ
jgi:TPR repeat protein